MIDCENLSSNNRRTYLQLDRTVGIMINHLREGRVCPPPATTSRSNANSRFIFVIITPFTLKSPFSQRAHTHTRGCDVPLHIAHAHRIRDDSDNRDLRIITRNTSVTSSFIDRPMQMPRRIEINYATRTHAVIIVLPAATTRYIKSAATVKPSSRNSRKSARTEERDRNAIT